MRCRNMGVYLGDMESLYAFMVRIENCFELQYMKKDYIYHKIERLYAMHARCPSTVILIILFDLWSLHQDYSGLVLKYASGLLKT